MTEPASDLPSLEDRIQKALGAVQAARLRAPSPLESLLEVDPPSRNGSSDEGRQSSSNGGRDTSSPQMFVGGGEDDTGADTADILADDAATADTADQIRHHHLQQQQQRQEAQSSSSSSSSSPQSSQHQHHHHHRHHDAEDDDVDVEVGDDDGGHDAIPRPVPGRSSSSAPSSDGAEDDDPRLLEWGQRMNGGSGGLSATVKSRRAHQPGTAASPAADSPGDRYLESPPRVRSRASASSPKRAVATAASRTMTTTTTTTTSTTTARRERTRPSSARSPPRGSASAKWDRDPSARRPASARRPTSASSSRSQQSITTPRGLASRSRGARPRRPASSSATPAWDSSTDVTHDEDDMRSPRSVASSRRGAGAGAGAGAGTGTRRRGGGGGGGAGSSVGNGSRHHHHHAHDDHDDSFFDSSFNRSFDDSYMADGGPAGDSASVPGPRSRSRSRQKLTEQEALMTSKRLYENAVKLRAKRQQVANTVPDGCTFAPEVTAKARKRGVATGQERFEHLYRNAEAIKKKLEHERTKKDPTLTFKPRVTPRSRSAMRSRDRSSVSAGDRLYHDAKKAAERKRELARKLAAEEKARHSRRVPRSRTPAPRQRKPLYSPAQLKAKKEIYERERLASEMEGCTFKPRLSRSRSVPPRRSGDDGESRLPVHERLQRYAKAVASKREAARNKAAQHTDTELTFKPKITPLPRSMSASRSRRSSDARSVASDVSDAESTTSSTRSGAGGGSRRGGSRRSNVFNRLHSEADLLKKRLKDKRRHIMAEQGETFRPYISQRSREIAGANRDPSGMITDRLASDSESVDEYNESALTDGGNSVFDRLYSDHKRVSESLELKRQEVAKEEVADCTFRPQTNAMMRTRKGGPEVWKRLYQESQTNSEVHQLWSELRKREELEGCTFHPEINHNVPPPPLRSEEEDVWDWLSKPKKKATPVTDPEATFKPKINKKSKQVALPTNGNVDAVYDRLYANALRSEKLRSEVLARIKVQEELADCTFVPQINKGYMHGSGAETVHNRLFRHAQHLQQQQRLQEEEAEFGPPSPPRSIRSRSRSRSRSRARGRGSAASSRTGGRRGSFSSLDHDSTPGYPARRAGRRGSADEGRNWARRADAHDPVDVEAILERAIASPPDNGGVEPDERWEVTDSADHLVGSAGGSGATAGAATASSPAAGGTFGLAHTMQGSATAGVTRAAPERDESNTGPSAWDPESPETSDRPGEHTIAWNPAL